MNSTLTVKIDNFLTVIYSQVISAMRQATSTLATSLQVEALQSDATGIPFASYNSIHEAAETILKSLCLIDANIDTYKKEPLDVVTNYISVCLGNMQTKEELVKHTVDAVIKSIVDESTKIVKNLSGNFNSWRFSWS